jgi:hypothetical protein
MHPSPIIIAKANLSQEIKNAHAHPSIANGMKPKVNPITPKPLHRFVNHAPSLNTGITSSAIPVTSSAKHSKTSRNENSTELNIKKYLEKKEKNNNHDDISSQHSEMFGFQQNLSRIQNTINSNSPSTPYSPGNNNLTPGTTTAIKLLTQISGVLMPFSSDEQSPINDK